MKSIDVKSLLIGFLLCATFFLSVGATSNAQIGRWAISSYGFYSEYDAKYEEEVFLLDTIDGTTYKFNNKHQWELYITVKDGVQFGD
tara:strand:- start:342 stop:602 length:261 start_codon:yes stop_codon:yes gene_type:complete